MAHDHEATIFADIEAELGTLANAEEKREWLRALAREIENMAFEIEDDREDEEQ